jgi:hypothetical protein
MLGVYCFVVVFILGEVRLRAHEVQDDLLKHVNARATVLAKLVAVSNHIQSLIEGEGKVCRNLLVGPVTISNGIVVGLNG